MIVFSLLSIGLTSGYAGTGPAEKIDDVLREEVDLTGHGLNGSITLHLQADDVMHPFKWTLEISCKGKLVFRHVSDDEWLDKFFADSGYVGNCEGYLDCKKRYYYHNILRYLFVKTDLEASPHAFSKSNLGSIHTVARNYLKDVQGLSDKAIDELVQKMIKRIGSGQAPILYVPISPVQNNFPRMYVEEIGLFVPVYEW